MLSIHQCATLACILDITAPKPGNVHRGADFADVGFLDFAASAVAIGPIMENAPNNRLGQTILAAIQATREVTQSNTNLGIVLLLAPLATVGKTSQRRADLGKLLRSLTADDARDVFAAIRLAQPGGMGEAEEMDVNSTSMPTDLLQAMQLSANRDLIAKQYVTDFELVTTRVQVDLVKSCQEHGVISGILDVFVRLLAEYPDSLIQRKCGTEVAEQARQQARIAVTAGPVNSEAWSQGLAELDFWLRADGNRRNPGTFADLITAGIFTALVDNELPI